MVRAVVICKNFCAYYVYRKTVNPSPTNSSLFFGFYCHRIWSMCKKFRQKIFPSGLYTSGTTNLSKYFPNQRSWTHNQNQTGDGGSCVLKTECRSSFLHPIPSFTRGKSTKGFRYVLRTRRALYWFGPTYKLAPRKIQKSRLCHRSRIINELRIREHREI